MDQVKYTPLLLKALGFGFKHIFRVFKERRMNGVPYTDPVNVNESKVTDLKLWSSVKSAVYFPQTIL